MPFFPCSVMDRIRENEILKQIRFKQGLVKVSEAYVEMGQKCAIVFDAQREIALQLPDYRGDSVDEVKYTGV